MPATALRHFTQDLSRAAALVAHASLLPAGTPEERLVRSDVLRSAWMFAVGALDAYFCDAYADIVAAAVISRSRHEPTVLPEFFYDVKVPIRAVLEPYAHQNWRWRMAARKMMERENVLSLATIQTLFNKFFRRGQRFFRDLLPTWIVHPDARRRLFGITGARFVALTGNARTNALDNAQELLENGFWAIFQRRHDCIHNCEWRAAAPCSPRHRFGCDRRRDVSGSPLRRAHHQRIPPVPDRLRLSRRRDRAGGVLSGPASPCLTASFPASWRSLPARTASRSCS